MKTIAHISDMHFGTEDRAVVEGLIDDVVAQKPHVVVASGDFTQRARRSQYAAAAEFMRRLPQPQIVVPGNHDIPLFDVLLRFFAPLNRYREYISRDLRPVYRDEELLIIGINTARSWSWTWDGFWKDGRISEEQLLDVKLSASDVSPDVFKVVVTHHPFIPPPGERVHGIVHGATRALAQMEESGVDMLLAGHLHMGYSGDVRTHHEATKRSIISIQAGTATSDRRRGEPNAYNLIEIDGETVCVNVRAWNGRAFGVTDITRYRKDGNEWHAELTSADSM
jgi:3',5'-cyclic AMP phosphodiesterase CpdA